MTARASGRIGATVNEDGNAGQILDLLRNSGPLSRVEISQILGISRSSVTEVTGRLIKSGTIEEVVDDGAQEAPRRGRPRVKLALNTGAAHAVGVRVSLDHLTVSVTDFACNVIGSAMTRLPRTRQPAADVAAQVVEVVRMALRDCGLPETSVNGICVGVPGLVDTNDGICHWSPTFEDLPVDFAALVEQHIGIPTLVVNHSIGFAMAEKYFGRAGDVATFAAVTISHGVTMGLVVDGHVHPGAHGFASELGHSKIAMTGTCQCGQVGCLEAFTSFWGVLRLAEGLMDAPAAADPEGRERQVMELAARARDGHEGLREVFATMGRSFGRGLANLVTLVDPELIIIGGSGLKNADLWMDHCKAELFASTLSPVEDRLSFDLHEIADEFWARGAAATVLHRLYRVPRATK